MAIVRIHLHPNEVATAIVLAFGGVQRLVQVADEVRDEKQSFAAVARRFNRVFQDGLKFAECREDVVAVVRHRIDGVDVEFHIDVEIVPLVHLGVLRLVDGTPPDRVGPVRQTPIGERGKLVVEEQFFDGEASVRRQVFVRNFADEFVPIFTPPKRGRSRRKWPDNGKRQKSEQPFEWKHPRNSSEMSDDAMEDRAIYRNKRALPIMRAKKSLRFIIRLGEVDIHTG